MQDERRTPELEEDDADDSVMDHDDAEVEEEGHIPDASTEDAGGGGDRVSSEEGGQHVDDEGRSIFIHVY